MCSSFKTKSTFFCEVSEARTALWPLQASLALSYESLAVMNFRQEFPTRCQLSPQTFSGTVWEGTVVRHHNLRAEFPPDWGRRCMSTHMSVWWKCRGIRFVFVFLTWQRNTLLVAWIPLTVLIHSTALTAGFLVTHIWRVVSRANLAFCYRPLGEGCANEQLWAYSNNVELL